MQNPKVENKDRTYQPLDMDRQRYDHFHSYSGLNQEPSQPVTHINHSPGISFKIQSNFLSSGHHP